jgi:cyclase
MLEPRIIPCLLLHKDGLFKTVKFKAPVYVGDPINVVKIFNEKGADELILLDIDATVSGKNPSYDWIRDIVSEAFMPITYGGGVKSLQQMEVLFQLGIEKVALSSAALENPKFVSAAASKFGSQSVTVVVDYKRSFWSRHPLIYTHNGKRRQNIPLLEWVQRVEKLGAGEVIINSIERDGTMIGYEHETIQAAAAVTAIPIVAMGGASSVNEMHTVISASGASGAAAGSLFVFRAKGQGVLVNYPPRPAI